MIFLKSLIAEYLRLCGVKINEYGDIWKVNDTPVLDEIKNEFNEIQYSKNTSGLINKRALQMNGKLTDIRPNQIIQFKMSYRDLKEKAQKYNVTITAFVLGIIFIAINKAIDNMKGDINIQLPVDMRRFHKSKTVRNFTMYCGILLDITEITTMEEITKKINTQLEEKVNKEKLEKAFTMW